MNYKFLALLLVSPFALAQAPKAPADCTLVWDSVITDGARSFKQHREVSGLSAADLQTIQARALIAVNKLEDSMKKSKKDGPVTITLTDSSTCEGKPTGGAPMEYRGATEKEANKFGKDAGKADAEWFGDIDKKHAAGKKAWGK